jgi:hypothetical protein
MKVIGDVPWSIVDPKNDINAAGARMLESFGVPDRRNRTPGAEVAENRDNHMPGPSEMGGYWPSYLFNVGKVGQRVAPNVGMPIGGARVGSAGRAHAANEFLVIEGAGKTFGMAGAEKALATEIYNYAGLN